MGEPVRIGIVGLGAISNAYFSTFDRTDRIRVVAVADLDAERAARVAAERGALALTVSELVAHPDVDLVLNLTIPAAHADVDLAALHAGKPVYAEKPLAVSLADAREVVDVARSRGLRLGSAPDTVLGTGIQTARRAIDDGLVGRPIGATATMVTPGHERWHPNPDFYYQPGGGPLLDMGPYYVTALVTLLGPVDSVVASASRSRESRIIGSGTREGEVIPVAVYTHVSGVLRHASGALSTLLMSFDAVATRASSIEVHGESGSLVVPDPNTFDGDVMLHALGDDDWHLLPPSAGYQGAARGVGVLDLGATQDGAQHRANGDLALHALDVMLSVLDAAATGASVALSTTCDVPAAVPLSRLP